MTSAYIASDHLRQEQLSRILNKNVRAVLLIDVVDSVRMMATEEERTVRRWLDVVEAVRGQVLPRSGGRIVKSLGDGLLLDFSGIRAAVEAAFSIQELSRRQNEARPQEEHILLRMGIEIGSVIVDDLDVYGHSVNLAARLMTTLAGPGEIVMTADAHNRLTPVLDAEVEDLGDCYLKSIEDPVRAYRIWPPGSRPTILQMPAARNLRPAIAVIPFSALMPATQYDILGEVLADGVIFALSRSQNVDVISRLSTTAFRGRDASVAGIGGHLRASYVLSGIYRTDNEIIVLDLELAEVRSERIIWSKRFRDKVTGIFDPEPELIDHIVVDVYNAVTAEELRRARARPLATLESYSLLLSAITLMHRRSARDFLFAREMLQTVIAREARQPVPLAWLANWHVLRIQQGMSDDIKRDNAEAVRCANSALDLDPDSSLALAVDGLVHTHMTKRHDLAADRYKQAITNNPNDALAWLVKGTHHAFTGDGEQAVQDTQRALKLSPLDPHSYYYHSLSATAYVIAGDNDMALRYADRSLRANKLHTSTLRVKAVAQWRLGLFDAARQTAAELLRLEPQLSVSSWLKRSPSANYELGRQFGRTLLEVGIPE